MTVLVGVFDREEDLLQAAAAARHDGLDIVDVFAPYAVHGLDPILNARPTRLPWVCFVLGLAGALTAMAFQLWSSAISWPINIGGKPWNSWPAFVPVAFEVMVLFAGMGTVAAFVWAAGLRPGRRVELIDGRVTDDRFAIVLRAAGARFDREGAKGMLARCHAAVIEEREG
jgi:hypothetical protein